MSVVEILMLRCQVLDYAESEEDYEAIFGQLLHENTMYLDGEAFPFMLRRLLDGLRVAMDRFEKEWEIIK